MAVCMMLLKTVADYISHESIGFLKSANFIKVISVLCLYCASVVLQQTRRVATRKQKRLAKNGRALSISGGSGRNRTTDTRIFNPKVVAFITQHWTNIHTANPCFYWNVVF